MGRAPEYRVREAVRPAHDQVYCVWMGEREGERARVEANGGPRGSLVVLVAHEGTRETCSMQMRSMGRARAPCDERRRRESSFFSFLRVVMFSE